MANDIQNRLQVIGDNEEVQKVLAFFKNENGEVEIDFNKIKPIPEELKIAPKPEILRAVMKALKLQPSISYLCVSSQIKDHEDFKSPLELPDEDWQLYIQCLNNVRFHEFINWFDWTFFNWGTKSDAYGQGDKRNTSDTIYFATANTSPLGIIIELSKMFPLVKFDLTHDDLDAQIAGGEMIFENGKIIDFIPPKDYCSEDELDGDFEKHLDGE